MTRVAVFIDYQNTYMGARRAFRMESDPSTSGQIYPRRLGIAVTSLGRGVDASRRLEIVKVFRGEPSPLHSSKGQAACQRQLRYWAAQICVEPVSRPLQYSPAERDRLGNVTKWEAREKGIDVLIALAMVTGAVRDEYDVAVLMSVDTDLVPALEQVRDAGKRAEVAAWSGSGASRSRLNLSGGGVWCHWLDRQWYDRLCDPTDYTQPQSDGPSANP
jgi:hypothetical protein